MRILICLMAAVICAPAQSTEVIHPQAQIYIDAASGFDVYVSAEMAKKRVPVVLTTDKSKAQYEMQAASGAPGFRMVNLSSNQVVFVCGEKRGSSAKEQRRAAKSCVKRLERAMKPAGMRF